MLVNLLNNKNKNVSYLDGSCTNHMSGDKKIFLDLDTSITSIMRLGNGAVVEAKGKHTVALKTKTGIRYIRDVLLVPGLAQNLLSVGQLLEHGYHLYFENNSCKVFDKKNNGQVIAKVKTEKNINLPIEFYYENVSLKYEALDDSWLWYKRYCHLNFYGLKLLSQKKMVDGLPTINSSLQPCEACIMGKQHKVSFPKGRSWRAGAPLELIHTNLCCPIKTPSLCQCRYFLTFIDDYSRMIWVHFLKEKSEVLMLFKRLKHLLKNKVAVILRQFEVIEEENKLPRSLKNTAKMKVFRSN